MKKKKRVMDSQTQLKKKQNQKIYRKENRLAKHKKENALDIILAHFWRYGYFFTMILIPMLAKNKEMYSIMLFCEVIVYGIWTIMISRMPTRYFLLGMLDAERQKMKLAESDYNSTKLKQWQKEGLWMGLIFSFFGVIGLIVMLL